MQFQLQKHLQWWFIDLLLVELFKEQETFLGVGPTTTSKYTHMICEALVDNFYDKYIKILEGQQSETIMPRFRKITNIPYMWGAIDGSYIVPIK
jgi:hypothetical protein